MQLDDLLNFYQHADEQLIKAIQQNCDTSVIDGLDKRIDIIVKTIAQVHLTNTLDINKQIKFFMKRSHSASDQSISEFDFNTVEDLIDRYTNRSSVNPSCFSANNIPDSQVARFINNEPEKTKELIVNSKSRISLFDTNHSYKYTSIGNSVFHTRALSSFDGTHLADVIGKFRFKNRSKTYYERCFAGKTQSYNYFLENETGEDRLYSCQLIPHRDNDGAVRGAFFEVDDITDDLTQKFESDELATVN